MFKYIKLLSSLSRSLKVSLQMLCDSILILFSFFISIFMRFESTDFINKIELWILMLCSAVLTLIIFWAVGVYRNLVRYITEQTLFLISYGLIISTILSFCIGLLFEVNISNSIYFTHFIVSFLLIGGMRFIVRRFFKIQIKSQKIPIIIYGAGKSGSQLFNSLLHGRDYLPVAMVDDDTSKHNFKVSGLKVYPSNKISQLVNRFGVQLILLAMPSIERSLRRKILNDLKEIEIEVKTIPSVTEIISGQAKISEIRHISLEDLLGREAVAPEYTLLAKNISQQVVMVTGAGGSIGSELCRQIIKHQPVTIVLFERSEYGLYTVEAEIAKIIKLNNYSTEIIAILSSVQNRNRLQSTIQTFGVQTIYHSAAYKHVPLVEENIVEAMKNNVFGTLSVAKAAKNSGVQNCILISTDKAVRPTNIMGATKRIAELIFQSFASKGSKTIFSMVRFGNVLGSSGSVIPRFQSQLESGGPITVTHKEINRYFMTIPEAAQLVIQAGAMATGGDVFVLDMGKSVKILDLATTMIKLQGLKPEIIESEHRLDPNSDNFPILITGLRKGEKLYEELLIGNNSAPTNHSRIMTANESYLPDKELEHLLSRLKIACDVNDLEEIISILHKFQIDYMPNTNKISDILWVNEKNKHEKN